ncbi:MAG: peptide chain release factor N(5)-glutamine methyltransferase [Alphaproteobacteria bacterium]|nr:peptide chain release factor N(5)-glutamine methyltransferase [Alphaproteobacteria bacterium]MDE2629842.1 peptide chain release factor N(5)-glutamine methyltransferase [Alphaproteobacteria bacterium]
MSETLLRDAVRRLAAAGIENPRLDARLLLEHAHGDNALFEALVCRRAAREPLAYITGRKEFWSLDFEVGPDVLIPRPESETVIEQALAAFPDRAAPLDVLDLGTGTGCLLVAFLKEFPNACGLGIDVSQKARAIAHRNVVRHGLAARGAIDGGDWSVAGSYDVILANPPYIETGDLAGLEPEGAYEPVLALDGGADGLSAYRAVVPVLAVLLRPGGRALLEIGAGQEGDVAAVLALSGLGVVRTAPDLAGIPRVLVAAHRG